MFTNPPFDPDNFSDNDIDNPNLPMEPGSLWVYRSEDELNFVWVTDQTKEIAGVETTVARDVVFSDGGASPCRRHLYPGECARRGRRPGDGRER